MSPNINDDPQDNPAHRDNPLRYWFAAKTYGWGWGLPLTWEGWVVFTVFLALLLMAQFAFPPNQDPLRYAGATMLLVIVFILICMTKGEPTSWRWGKPKD